MSSAAPLPRPREGPESLPGHSSVGTGVPESQLGALATAPLLTTPHPHQKQALEAGPRVLRADKATRPSLPRGWASSLQLGKQAGVGIFRGSLHTHGWLEGQSGSEAQVPVSNTMPTCTHISAQPRPLEGTWTHALQKLSPAPASEGSALASPEGQLQIKGAEATDLTLCLLCSTPPRSVVAGLRKEKVSSTRLKQAAESSHSHLRPQGHQCPKSPSPVLRI